MLSFESHIKGSKPVVVDFFAEWCNPCRLMTPVLHEVKEKVGDRATVLKIDIDKYPDVVNIYDVRAVPTLMIFKEGEVMWRKSGVTPSNEVLQHLNMFIS
ncbi:MAG TPA: thioredoxin [Chitinophagaceae bacterium]|nr:thioredoxin [Chitinophagaceae bacterium]